MQARLVTAPLNTPVQVSDVSAQVRFDVSSENTLITAYINAITEKAQTVTRRALITQTWELALDRFPLYNFNELDIMTNWKRGAYDTPNQIKLPMSPLQMVNSIKYIDVNGVLQTIDSSTYSVDTYSDVPRVAPAVGYDWPGTILNMNAVRVNFTCGYGVDSTFVPDAIRTWILINVANLYENRETETIANGRLTMVDLSTLADSLLDSYRVMSFS